MCGCPMGPLCGGSCDDSWSTAPRNRTRRRMMGWMAPLRHRRAKLVFSRITRNREPSMSEITTIGLDLAKHVFQAHGIDAEGTTVLRKRLRRGQVLAFFSRIPRCVRSEEHTSELQSPCNLVCRLLLEKKKKNISLIAAI